MRRSVTEVIIYTQSNCRLSEKAVQLLDSKGIRYDKKDVSHDVFLKREMIELSGGRVTNPQIFYHSKHLGGCDDLFTAFQKGILQANTNKLSKKKVG